jgi:hypothetical protein
MVSLGGQLGVRFPTEAVRWLWRSQQVEGIVLARLARSSLAELWCSILANGGKSINLLRFVNKQISSLSSLEGDFSALRKAVETAAMLLGSVDSSSGWPIPALALRLEPTTAVALGNIWSAVLRSRATNSAGVEALARTVSQIMKSGTPEDKETFAVLGSSVRANMDNAEREELRVDLEESVASNRRGRGDDSDSPDDRSEILTQLLGVL